MNILEHIKSSKAADKKLLAILIDPDKVTDIPDLIESLQQLPPDMIFVGGSTVEKKVFDTVIEALHTARICPVVIFPGDYHQINDSSDAILLLSLISGRNPEYLIEQHIKAAKTLNAYPGEVIPTSYVLLNGGKQTSVQTVSQTTPILQSDIDLITDTIIAGKLLGHQLHYLEAGSGANQHVSEEIIRKVKAVTPNPIIVGGGIRNAQTAEILWKAGADLLVIGNGFEDRSSILKEIDVAKHNIDSEKNL